MKRKWWLLAAGVVFSCARWWRHVEPVAPVDGAVIVVDDKTARAAGDFEIELTRARRVPRTKKLASTLLFVTLFCAGAAFTAGAGNELVSTDETTAVAEAAAPSPEPAADAAPAPAAPAEAPPAEPPAEPAAEPPPAVTPAPVEEAAPAPAPEAAPTPESAPEAAASAPSDDVTPASAPARADYVAPAATETAAPSTVPLKKKDARRAVQHSAHAPPPVPQVVVAATPFFVPAVPFDLTAWEHDNPGSTTGTAAVAIAQHFVGTPYVWGGASPTGGFDCSGLMLYVYSQLGVRLPHYAAAQFALFPKLQPDELQPGDLVFFEPKLDGPGHVAMYAGGDAIIEAPHTGALVRIGDLSRSAAALGFMGAVRPYTSHVKAARTIAGHHSARAQASGIGTASSIFAA
jgi:cell wall-associated NlpC family hydrolase